MQYHSRVLPCAVAAALVAGAAPCAVAAEWSVDPTLQWRMDYDSNRLLSPAAARGGEGATLAVEALLKAATETAELDITPHLDLQRFHPQSTFDATNTSLQLASQTRTERSTFGLTADYERASSLITEPSDTGVIDAATRRETASASLSAGHDFTARQHLDLQGAFSDVRYPNGLRLNLIGYRYPSVSLTYTVALSERTTMSLAPYADRLTAPQTGYRSDDRGARLTARHSFSDLLSGTIAVGYSSTSLPHGSAHGTLWHAELTRKRDERTQWTGSYDRSVQPSGRGVLVRRDDLGLAYSRSIASQWSATASAHDVRNAVIGSGPLLEVPHYFSADGGLQWQPAPAWMLSLTAGSMRVHEPSGGEIADGWHVGFTLRWSPLPYSLSR